MLKKILIANRGEIAIRVIQACKELDIVSVAIFAENDRDSFHVEYSDESYNLGSGALNDTYLNIDKIIEIAKKASADAIHPGYGFLSENANFPRACKENGIIFIGPDAKIMEMMGNKISARNIMKEANVPIVPGSLEPLKDISEIIDFGEKYGYPIVIKASSGGGGRGLTTVYKSEDIEAAFEKSKREGKNYFGDDTVYIEKYFDNPRHIEVQFIGDNFGNVVHIGERNCSVQRRHQKLIEESPSPYLSEEIKQKIFAAAIKGAKHLSYSNAGTFEFLEQDGEFYFLEVNTRLQVEHPVSEMVYGIDLVKEQISVASGNKLNYSQEDLIPRGHAIEYRITVEDVSKNFRPMAGFLEDYSEPTGFGVRVDSIAKKGWSIPSEYDSMIAKLIIWDESRDRVIKKSKRVLEEFKIKGVPTTIDFHKWAIQHEEFIEGNYSTSFIGKYFNPDDFISTEAQTVDQTEKETEKLEIEVNGKLFQVVIHKEADKNKGNKLSKRKGKSDKRLPIDDSKVVAPMASTVVKVQVEAGSEVKKGEVVLVVAAMKMETDIQAPKDGTIKDVFVKEGDSVPIGKIMMSFE